MRKGETLSVSRSTQELSCATLDQARAALALLHNADGKPMDIKPAGIEVIPQNVAIAIERKLSQPTEFGVLVFHRPETFYWFVIRAAVEIPLDTGHVYYRLGGGKPMELEMRDPATDIETSLARLADVEYGGECWYRDQALAILNQRFIEQQRLFPESYPGGKATRPVNTSL